MRGRDWVPRAAVAALIGFGFAMPVIAADGGFSPREGFPKESFLYAEIDLGGIVAALPQTPLGRIASHPQTLKALGDLPAMLRRQFAGETRNFAPALGGDVFAFLEAIGGRWSFALEAKGPTDPPNVYAALDLRGQKDGLLRLVGLYAGIVAPRFGVEPSQRVVSGHEVTSIVPDGGDLVPGGGDLGIFAVVLGDHLVLGMAPTTRFDAVIERFARSVSAGGGSAASGGIASAPSFATAREGELARPLVTVFLDVEGLRRVFLALFERPGAEERLATARAALEALGIDRLASIDFQLALNDSDWETRLALRSPDRLGGLVGLLAESFDGAGNADAYSRVPESASVLASYAIDKGRFFRGVGALIAALPESIPAAPFWQQVARHLEEATGLSLADDLEKLPRLEVTSFLVPSPSGGLFPDGYAVCRLAQILPYLQALDKLAHKTGAEIRPLEIGGRSVAWLRIESVMRALGVGPATGPLATLPDGVKRLLVALDPSVSIAFTPLDDEWILLADSPQAIERYLLVHAQSTKVAESARWRALLAAFGSEKGAFCVLGGGESALAGYNSLLSVVALLAPTMEDVLAELHVDLALLPPAEEFLPLFRPGFVLVGRSEGVLVIRSHRLLTNALPLVVPDVLDLFVKIAPILRGVARVR